MDYMKVLWLLTVIPCFNSQQLRTNLRLSERKCLEYNEYVYKNKTIYLPVPDSEPEIIRTSICELRFNRLVAGGSDAEAREFPHMARLGYGNLTFLDWRCGGTIISRRFILSAAHCFIHGKPAYVRIGDLVWNTDSDDAKPQTIRVESTVSHPEYKYPSNYHDIGLVKVENVMTFDLYARPACLNPISDFPILKAMATGWGQIDFMDKSSDHLQMVILDLFKFNECKDQFSKAPKLSQGLIEDQHICAGSKDTIKDTCPGDSGGPLQVYHKLQCMYSILGVVSFGNGCAVKGSPGVYTRVSNYIDWIEENAFADE